MNNDSRPARVHRSTIKDVARIAQVSVTTVSNVLNGRSSSMTEETLTRVQDTIRELGYRPNDIARGLVRRRTSTIGLVIAEVETPLFLQAIPVIQPLARRSGFDVLIYNAHDSDSEEQAVELLLEKDVAGVIFLSTSRYVSNDHVLRVKAAGKPSVLVNRSTLPDDIDTVNMDNEGSMAIAVNHLTALGHTRIAQLHGPPHRHSSKERMRGYRTALESNDLPFDDRLQRLADFTADPETWRDAVRELIRQDLPPTAIIAADDSSAAVAIGVLQQAGFRVPEDVSILGINDQFFAPLLNPALTSLRLPIAEAGRLAVEILLARIAGDTSEAKHLLLDLPLILRDSTGPAPQ